jgi:hypothetical protein
VTNAERGNEFSPRALRKLLKERDGDDSVKSKNDMYALFSEHAAHLTYPALRMLRLPDGSTRVGPTDDERQVFNCLYELGRQVFLVATAEIRVLIAISIRDKVPVNAGPFNARLAAFIEEGRTLFRPKRKPAD